MICVTAPTARRFQACFCFLFQLMKSLGVNETWRFFDVVGLESEQLSGVPKPCCALMLLFPLTEQVMMGLVKGSGWSGWDRRGLSEVKLHWKRKMETG